MVRMKNQVYFVGGRLYYCALGELCLIFRDTHSFKQFLYQTNAFVPIHRFRNLIYLPIFALFLAAFPAFGQQPQVLYLQNFENYNVGNTYGFNLNQTFLPQVANSFMTNRWTTGSPFSPTVDSSKCLYVRCSAGACLDEPSFRSESDNDQSNSVTTIAFPNSALPAGGNLRLEFDWISPRTLPVDPQAGLRLVYRTDGVNWKEFPQSFLNSQQVTTSSFDINNTNFNGYDATAPKLEIGFRWYNFTTATSDVSILIDNVRILFQPVLKALSVSPGEICSGDSLTVGFSVSGFQNGTNFGVELSPDDGFGSPTTLSPYPIFSASSIRPSFNGTKKVKIPASTVTGAYFIRLASSGGVFSDPLPVQINKTPDKPFAGSDVSLCSGADPITVGSATAEDGVVYSWNVPGLTGSQVEILTPFLTNTGLTKLTKTLIVTASSGGGTCVVESDPMLINIFPLPQISLVQGNPAICDNGGSDIIRFLVQPKVPSVAAQCLISAANITKFGNDTTFLFNPVGLTGAQELIYKHTFKWTSGPTCFAEETLSVKVNKAPIADPGASESFCLGGAPVNLVFPPVSQASTRWEGIGVSPAGSFNPSDNGIIIPVGQQSVTLQLSLIVTQFFTNPGMSCSDTARKPVRINRPPDVKAGVDDTLCQSSNTLPLVAYSPIGSGANVGTWSGPGIVGSSASGNPQNPVFTITPTGPNPTTQTNTLTYTFKNSDGCVAFDTKIITVRANPPANAGSNRTICSGQSTIVGGSAQTGLKYRWLEPAPQFFENPDTASSSLTLINQSSVLQKIKAKLKGTDAFNCSTKDSVEIKVFPVPIASVVLPADTESCEGDSIMLKADLPAGQFSIQWLRNGFPFSQASQLDSFAVKIPGKYSVKVAYATSECFATSAGVNLKFNPTIKPKIVGDQTFCGNSPTTMRAIPVNPDFSYEWRLGKKLLPASGLPEIQVAKSGLLTVVLRTDKGCTGYSDSVRIDSLPQPFIESILNDTIFCENSRFFYKTNLDTLFNYRWQDSSNRNVILSDSSKFYPRIAGTYYLEVFNKCGIAADTFKVLKVNPAPQFGILTGGKNDTTVCINQDFNLVAPSGFPSYRWDYFDSTLNTTITSFSSEIGPMPASTEDDYVVKLKIDDIYGCSNTDSIRVKLIKCPPQLFVANAFMPIIRSLDINSVESSVADNAVWFFDGYGLSSAKCYVYSRWGELVFTKEGWGRKNGWDGYFNDILCPTGTYKYLIEFTGNNEAENKVKRVTGNITLIR